MSWEALMLEVARRRMNGRRRAEFYRMLALLYRNLGDIGIALRDIAGNYSDDGRRHWDPIALLASDCADVFAGGERLSRGLSEWIPEDEVLLIAASEEAGDLQDGLRRAGEAVGRAEQVRRSLQQLVYPAALLAGVGLLMQQVGSVVVPHLLRLAGERELTAAGMALKGLATLVNTAGPLGALAAVGVVVGMFASLPYVTGPLRLWLERVPPWSMYRDLVGASFLGQVTLLQGGGVRLEDALGNVAERARPWLAERVDGVLQGIRNGATLGDALHEAGHRFPSPAAIRFLRTISGNEGAAANIETFAQDWHRFTLERLDSLIARVSTGVVVGFYAVIFLVFIAMNDISNAVMSGMPGGM